MKRLRKSDTGDDIWRFALQKENEVDESQIRNQGMRTLKYNTPEAISDKFLPHWQPAGVKFNTVKNYDNKYTAAAFPFRLRQHVAEKLDARTQ